MHLAFDCRLLKFCITIISLNYDKEIILNDYFINKGPRTLEDLVKFVETGEQEVTKLKHIFCLFEN